MRIAPTIVVVVAGLLAGLLAGCSGGDDDATPSSTAAVSGAIDSGLEPVELPAEFPTDVPIPADMEITGAEVLEGATTTLYEVTGWHPGDPVDVGGAYLAELEGLGYEVTGRTDAATSLYFTAQHDDWFVSAGFFADPIRLEGTSIGVTVGPATTG